METIHLDTEAKRSPLTVIIAFLCALAITALLFGGYLYLRRRHAERELAAQQQQAAAQPATKPAGPPLVQVYEDDAMVKGGQAVLGGTVVNISPETLSDITVELELKRRSGGATETRSLTLAPKDLTPEQRGRYELSVLSRDYSNARLVRINSKGRANGVPFKSAQGAQRPPERPPQSKPVMVPRPSPRKGAEEFINTPENPSRVP